MLAMLVPILTTSCSGSVNSSTSSSLSQATSDLVSIKFGNVTSVNLGTGIIMFLREFLSQQKHSVWGMITMWHFTQQVLIIIRNNSVATISISKITTQYRILELSIHEACLSLTAAQSAYAVAVHNMRAMYYMYIPPVSEVSDAALADYLFAQWKKSPYEPFLKEAGNPDISYKQELDNLVKLDTALKDAESTTNQLVGKPLPSSISNQLKIAITDKTE